MEGESLQSSILSRQRHKKSTKKNATAVSVITLEIVGTDLGPSKKDLKETMHRIANATNSSTRVREST
jgi:hypothetical protein